MDYIIPVDEKIELVDIMVECESLANDFNNLIIARDSTLNLVSQESYEIKSLQFESETEELWEKLKNKVLTFFEKVMNFFKVLWSKFQIEMLDFEMRFYKDNHIAIENGYNKAEKDKLKIIIKNWKSDNGKYVINDIFNDITGLSIALPAFYDIGDKLINSLLDDNSFDKKFANKINDHIEEGWNKLSKDLNLSIENPSDVRSSDIVKSISNKFYSKDYLSGDLKTAEVEISKFIEKDMISDIASPSSGKIIKKICNDISTKSSKLAMDLRMVNSAISKLAYSSDPNRDKKLSYLQSNSIKILTTIQSIAKTVGEQYLITYIGFRNDVKKIAKTLAKLGKE